MGAAIERNADAVRRARKPPEFLKLLGLKLPVSLDDVKQAYYAKARVAHPDHRGSASEFKEIQQAFEEALVFAERNGKRLPWIGAQLPLYLAQRDVSELVERWGGRVVVEQLDWLENTIGEDFAQLATRLKEIDLSGAAIGDADVGELIAIPDGFRYLEVLGLAGVPITDATALRIGGVMRLKLLDLRGTRVSMGVRRKLLATGAVEQVAGLNQFAEWTRKAFG